MREPKVYDLFRLVDPKHPDVGAPHILDAKTRRSVCTRACPRQVYSADDPRAECFSRQVGDLEGMLPPRDLCGRCWKLTHSIERHGVDPEKRSAFYRGRSDLDFANRLSQGRNSRWRLK